MDGTNGLKESTRVTAPATSAGRPSMRMFWYASMLIAAKMVAKKRSKTMPACLQNCSKM